MSRADRLNERFQLIQKSVIALHGERVAFAAASAAWLRAIQYGHEQGLLRIARYITDDVAKHAMKEELEGLKLLDEVILQGFHKEICDELDVDLAWALELSLSFEQVVQDICFQGG